MCYRNQSSLSDKYEKTNEWETQAKYSLLADTQTKKNSFILVIFVIVVFISIGIWLINQRDVSKSKKTKQYTHLIIPERKPVSKLKESFALTVPVIDATAAVEIPKAVNDAINLQHQQIEQQRDEQTQRLLEARLKSAIMPFNASQQASAAISPMMIGNQSENISNVLNIDQNRQGGQDTNHRFLQATSGSSVAVNQASQLEYLEYKILQGKLIEAVLEPRAISDLPGMICATIQRDVYGSQRRIKLIPWGSRVCGVYNAELRKGQERLFVVWNTLRRPDGVQVTLDSIGADQLGSVGMGGWVDHHFAQIFGVSTLLSIIGAGAMNFGVHADDHYNSSAMYRQSVQRAAAETASQILQSYSNVSPTVTVPAGSRVRIYVNRDLDFTSIYQKNDIEAIQKSRVIFLQ